jgi:NAD(P)H-dependent FMN reductase
MTATTTSTTPATPLRVAVITASTREGRFGPVVAGWFTGVLNGRADMNLDAIDLADTDLPATVDFAAADPRVAGFAERIGAADAFVVVTPEYNHSFPAPLKHALDFVRAEWQAKPVAFVSYGGMGGGLRAVEQLRLVFAELHAVTVRDSVSFHTAWERFGPNGLPHDAAGCEGAAKGMLDQLAWWGTTLRAGRAAHPYNA